MLALNHLSFVLIFTIVVSGFTNGEQYQADSDVERLPEIQAAAMIDKNEIDETATNNKSRKRNVARAHHASGHVDATQKKFAPKFKHPSKMFHMDMKPAGSSIRLRCAADGNPTPNITWYKNNDTIARRYFQPSYGKWSMSLDELTKTDNGNYTCVVCNELGCINHTVELQVQDRLYAKPVLTRGAVNQTKLVGETANFNCEFLSDMHPSIYWMYYKKYEYIYNYNATADSKDVNDNSRIITNDDIDDQPESLTIYNVTKEDEGWYVCVAINSIGKTSAEGYLTVLDYPNNSSYVEEPPEITVGSATNGPGTGTSDSPWLDAAPGAISSGVLMIAALITIITIVVIRKRRKNVIVKYWMKKIIVKKPEIDYTSPGSGDLVMPIVKIERQKLTQVGIVGNDTTLMSEYQLPVDSTWEILRSNMTFSGQVLGRGEFGKVVKAECNGIISEGVKTVVAVKMLKDGHSDSDMIALVSEMEIMKLIGKHENIINLLGCCTQDGPLYVVVEYARNGCLREFLKKHKPDKNPAENLMKERFTQGDLIDFALQVAKGMEYLTSRGCIHRDLAARNVLVSGARVLKVADFGLARDVRDSDYYRKRSAGRLPIKWMAPESIIQNMYTKRSDVWSFGVLSWEIMTFGSTPYPNVPVQYLYQWFKQGHRLEKPKGCSDEIYKYMMHCWTFEPEGRPTFVDLVQTLKTMSQTKDAVSSNLTSNTQDNQNLYH